MLNIIQNTIGAIRRVGESVVRAGLKMWLPFTKAEPLGEELVTNGDFSQGESGWSFGDKWSIDNGAARLQSTDSDGSSLVQYNVFVIGKTYLINFDAEVSSGTARLEGSSGVALITISETKKYSLVFTATTTSLIFQRVTSVSDLSIDNISVEEYAQETPDISGNDNNAILKTGKALQFTGNDSVQTSFPSSYTIKTIAFWINPTHSSTNEVVFYGGGGMAGTRELRLDHLQLEAINGNINMSTYVNGTLEGVTYNGTPATLTQDEWQRVVLTSSTGFTVVSDTFDIGSGLYGSDGRFIMSDLQIYDEAWTTDDIAYDYANPQKLVTDSEDTSITLDNLKAWWHLSEGDGTVAYDSAPLLGVNVVPNGDFSTDNISAISGGGTRSVENNKLKIQEDGLGYSQCIYYGLLDSNKTYKVTFDLTVGTGTYSIYDTVNGIVALDEGSGSYSFYISSPTGRLYIGGNGVGDVWYLDNITAKEVFNIDGETYDGSTLGATYVDAQERIPQLGMMNWSKGSNLLTYSEDFSQWATSGTITITSNYGISPDGTNNSTRIIFSSGNEQIYEDFTSTSGVTGSLYIKGTSGETIKFGVAGSESVFTLNGEWQRITKYISGSTSRITINTYSSATARDIQVWGAQVESGTTASAYRRTNGTAVTDATLISCATDSQKDILGNAVRVKGSGFNLDGTGYAVNETLQTITNNISLSFWVKLDTFIDNNLDHIIGRRTGLSWLRIYRYQANSLAFEVAAGVNLGFTINENQWVFVAATMDNNNEVKVYVDGGSPVTTTLSSGFTFVDTDPFSIGAWLNPNLSITSLAHGKIDDVQVYNRVLSSDEVEQNYNATKSGHNN